jgi:type II secretory pathway pseudopilin PulG
MNILENKNKGYSLVEMLIYVAILSIITFVLANTVLSFTRSYRDLASLRIVDHSGIDAMERMTRDIRASYAVDTANSILGTSPGVLTLLSTINGVTKTTKFYLNNGVIKVDVNGSYFGPLTLQKATINNLVFNVLDSGISKAVKVDMTVSAALGTTTKTKKYHSTIILKGI